jgi:hypothetical protein
MDELLQQFEHEVQRLVTLLKRCRTDERGSAIDLAQVHAQTAKVADAEHRLLHCIKDSDVDTSATMAAFENLRSLALSAMMSHRKHLEKERTAMAAAAARKQTKPQVRTTDRTITNEEDEEQERRRRSGTTSDDRRHQQLQLMDTPELSRDEVTQQILEERDREIRQLVRDMHELNSVMQEFARITVEAHENICTVDKQASNAAAATEESVYELSDAARENNASWKFKLGTIGTAVGAMVGLVSVSE